MTSAHRLRLSWSEHQGRDCLRVCGWTGGELLEMGRLAPAALGRRLAVLPSELVQAGTELPTLQPLAGHFAVDGDAIVFTPRFPFLDGMRYALLVDPAPGASGAGDREVWTILRPARAGVPTTDVVGIYPSADELPVNQLKLYVHFSGPMSEAWAARAVAVHRADTGEPLESVFLAMEPELRDWERRRVTLLLDPGRIKRGLVPNKEAGYPLIEGVPIVVRIEEAFRDAAGRPLRRGAKRHYTIGPPVRARVDPSAWRYDWPAAGSTDPLTVVFDRPLDHALLAHGLWLHDAAGVPLVGRGVAGPGERSWRFEPQSPWDEARYFVIVDPQLEDLAGNSLIRVFDRDLTRVEDAPTDARQVAIAFTCASPGAPLRTERTNRE